MIEAEADVVVVGAGAVGASVAYHLARAGRKVIVVERETIASGCSSATYAGINISAKEGHCYVKFTLEASRLHAGLEEELGADLEYWGQGSIAHVVEKESEWPAVLRNVEEVNRVPGVNIEVLRTPEARKLEPGLPSWIQGIAFCPVDGFVNPHKLVGAYVRSARRLGAEILPYAEVRGIDTHSGAVQAVATSRGKIHTPWVVNAAGIDSPRIGRMVGAILPVVPAHGQVATTVRVKPFLRYAMRGLVQKESGNLFVGSTKSFVGPGKAPRVQLIPAVTGKPLRLFPFLRDLPVARIWTGIRPLAGGRPAAAGPGAGGQGLPGGLRPQQGDPGRDDGPRDHRPGGGRPHLGGDRPLPARSVQRGFDRPILVQSESLARAAVLDFGISLRYQQPVTGLILDRMPATLELTFAALFLSTALAIPAGAPAGLRRNSLYDNFSMLFVLMGQSMPVFWLGILLILVFAVELNLFPTSGRGGLDHLVLPAVTLGAYSMARIARLMRSSILEVMGQDYIRTARAKGLRERLVVMRHALKNASISVVTVTGYTFSTLVGGAIITETIFAWPGVGWLMVQGVQNRDYPLVQATVFIVALFVALSNLVVDLSYKYLDPRIRY